VTGLKESVLARAHEELGQRAEAARATRRRVLVAASIAIAALGAGFAAGWEARGPRTVAPGSPTTLGSNHLEAARALEALGFHDEARAHAQKVVDDPHSTADEVARARQYLR